MGAHSYFKTIRRPLDVVTAIPTGLTFPESLEVALNSYKSDILNFQSLVNQSTSSADLLARIRSNSVKADTRMSLLKLFRRCVSLVCDTESTKKIVAVSTESIVANFGDTFKPIASLKTQFASLSEDHIAALAVLMAENDGRGQSGYALTGRFFDWFESVFRDFDISGPRGAGPDIELSSIFPDFVGSYPCDFVIKDKSSGKVCAVGFARYDSTRGGSQSDDRTGGNSNKVEKAKEYYRKSGNKFRIIFLADGPGLTHKDTWEEACNLDGQWDDNVRVTTLKLAKERVSREWLRGL